MKQVQVALAPMANADGRYDTGVAREVARSLRTRLIFNGVKVAGDYSLITNREAAVARAAELQGQSFDLLLVLLATFAESELLIDLSTDLDCPLFLWAVPEPEGETGTRVRFDALGGLHHAVHALKAHNVVYHYVYAQPGDRDATGYLKQVAAAAAILPGLRQALAGDEYDLPGCEGNGYSRLSQLMLHWLSERPAPAVHLLSADFDEDEAVLSICSEIEASSLKTGPVTLARLSQREGALRLVVTRGELRSRYPAAEGGDSAVVVRFDRPVHQVVQRVLDEGLEPHLALTSGDHEASLSALATMLDVPLLRL